MYNKQNENLRGQYMIEKYLESSESTISTITLANMLAKVFEENVSKTTDNEF